MAFFNYATMQMAAKIVYYGPGLCGKTTNLQYIYNKTSNSSRGEMVSLETETDRTLFFDLLPLEVGVIAGFKTRFQLYTVPGQVFYGETRKMVLKGVDGIVFVADSQQAAKEANIESFKDLINNLRGLELDIRTLPLVFQYNKRDLPNILPVDELQKMLNPFNYPYFEGIAVKGVGVFDTLKEISRLTLQALTDKLLKPQEKATKAVEIKATVIQKKAEEEMPKVEFATEKSQVSEEVLAKTTPKVRTVTSSVTNISKELDSIRERLLGPLATPQKPKMKDLISPALEDLKKFSSTPPPSKSQDVVTVAFPQDALKNVESLNMLLEIDSGKRKFREQVKVSKKELTERNGEFEIKIKLTPKKS